MTLALRLYGYTTHQQLQQGEYDWRDRTYSLAETDLNLDLSPFWVVRQFQPHELTRAAIKPITPLALEQAQSLLGRLGLPTLLTPRTSPLFDLGRFASAWRMAAAVSRTATRPARIVLDLAAVAIGCIRAAQQCGWSAVEFELSAIGARGTI